MKSPRAIWIAAVAIALIAPACRSGQNPTVAGGSPSLSASVSAKPSTEPCAKSEGGVQTTAYLTNVTLDQTATADRITFEFEPAKGVSPGVPSFEIADAKPPFTKDPSDQPLEVSGDQFTRVVFHGGSDVELGPEGVVDHYKGETEFKPKLEVIQEVEEQGDFEATLSWIIGLRRQSCPKATEASGPARLYLEFAH